MSLMLDQTWSPPTPRSRTAETTERSRQGAKGPPLCHARIVLCIRRFARNSDGDVRHNGSAEIDERVTGFRQESRANPWKIRQSPWPEMVNPAEAKIEDSATCSFSLCIRRRVVKRKCGQNSRTIGMLCHQSAIGFPSAAAEHVTASRMRILASNCWLVKSIGHAVFERIGPSLRNSCEQYSRLVCARAPGCHPDWAIRQNSTGMPLSTLPPSCVSTQPLSQTSVKRP